MADANAKKYRSPEEIEKYKARSRSASNLEPPPDRGRDPDRKEIEDIDVAAKEETNEAVKFAEESPFPQENEILSDVYWEVDHQTDAAQTRSILLPLLKTRDRYLCL